MHVQIYAFVIFTGVTLKFPNKRINSYRAAVHGEPKQ